MRRRMRDDDHCAAPSRQRGGGLRHRLRPALLAPAAGPTATAKAITTGVFHLLGEKQWSELAGSPQLAHHAAAELLRFAPPTGVARFAREDLVCRDVQLHGGQMAILDLEGACRDARRYTEPDTLDLTRETGRQLAFGAGPHFCLGANLAKVVLETAFRTLATRFPALDLACAPDDVRWDYDTFQGIVSLPVRALANDSGPFSLNYAAGVPLRIGVSTAAAACRGGAPANANVVVQYKAQ